MGEGLGRRTAGSPCEALVCIWRKVCVAGAVMAAGEDGVLTVSLQARSGWDGIAVAVTVSSAIEQSGDMSGVSVEKWSSVGGRMVK